MRLIDADALIDELQKDEAKFDKEAKDAQNDPSYTECYSEAMWSRANGIRDAMIEIHDAPTIDAVSVVRCKDCRWSKPNEFGDLDCQCHIPIFRVGADGFCSYGESKERGQTMKLKYFEATDSNGTDVYLFQLEDNSFISVPKEQLEFKPLSPEELQEMKGADDDWTTKACIEMGR